MNGIRGLNVINKPPAGGIDGEGIIEARFTVKSNLNSPKHFCENPTAVTFNTDMC